MICHRQCFVYLASARCCTYALSRSLHQRWNRVKRIDPWGRDPTRPDLNCKYNTVVVITLWYLCASWTSLFHHLFTSRPANVINHH